MESIFLNLVISQSAKIYSVFPAGLEMNQQCIYEEPATYTYSSSSQQPGLAPRVQGVGSSNLLAPTNLLQIKKGGCCSNFLFLFGLGMF
jgi:hypothetical protein